MKLKLNLISESERTDNWEVPVEWLNQYLQEENSEGDLVPPLFRSSSIMNLKTDVYQNGEEYYFRAALKGSLEGLCVRCLKEDLPFPLDIEFGGVFIPRAGSQQDEPEDPGHYFYGEEELDFSSAVRENVFLVLPNNPTCEELSGSSCDMDAELLAGDEEKFEEDKPKVDPRWGALLKIKESMEKSN